ncbi:glycosyltransferase [Lactococcus protaetiae]|uniref:Glycosyltransferase n=1 Tax=Lactococcus protaetiae TaxID=2592653 RepID=A0A514Z7A8_9LACT|nr:glycosyltransferase [Lactococcus protaetiae]QDK70480.1 glycosyltransferase [Lactococcus protaetiae]
MKTAVLMASYNGEKFITEQLDSIRKQSRKPDFVIIRDDCSSDNTVELIEKYISQYELDGWTITRNKTNVGWRANFRQLLLDSIALDAEIIFFSDQDDVWKEDKNAQQLNVMERHPDIEVLSGDLEFIKLDEKATIPNLYVFPDKEEILSKYPIHKNYQGGFRQGMTLAIRKSLIIDVMQYWKEEYKPTHDMVFQGIASLLGTGYNLNEVVATQKRHSSNASGKPIVSLNDSKEVHVQDLYEKRVGYHDIAYHVLEKRNSQLVKEQKDYLDWAKRRYEAAKTNHFWNVLKIIILDRKYYIHYTGQLRDLYFAFKKSNKV